MHVIGRRELNIKWKSERNTNDTEFCKCCVVNTDVEDESGGQSSLTVRVLCLPRTTSEILLSKTSTAAGTFCQ